VHDEIGFNYRLPNINAALGGAKMEKQDVIRAAKNIVANRYKEYLANKEVEFVEPLTNTKSNNWLNAIKLDSKLERDNFLQYTNDNGVMTRPIWQLMPSLNMFSKCQSGVLNNAKRLLDTVVTIPSSVPENY